jgi:two-component system alkaline phosphatase synthesis response regulator PhoP
MKLLCISEDETLNNRVRAESDRLSWSTVVVNDRSSISQAMRQYDPDVMLVQIEDLADLDWWIGANLTALKPVIFMNSEMTEAFMSSALEAGADGFLPKTLFSSRHFEARIKALLRRQNFGAAKRFVPRLKMTVDSEHYSVDVEGKTLNLTLTEFKILRELACEEAKVISRAEIQSRVFGDANLSTRSLDVHVCSLRKKIKPVDLDIDSVRGVGYRLNPCRK